MNLSLLGIGAVLLMLQLFLLHRCRRTADRTLATAAATIAILLNVALLETGHPGQRVRQPRHESFESVVLRETGVSRAWAGTQGPRSNQRQPSQLCR